MVDAIHPGNMVKTEIKRQWWLWRLAFTLASPFTKSCSQGKLFLVSDTFIKGKVAQILKLIN